MFHTKVLLTTLLMACALFVTVAVAAPVSNDQPVTASGDIIRTTLQPDLSFKSTLSPELLPQTNLRPKRGFCRCSCGYPCETSADCGGVSCDPFITCCVQGEQNQSLQPGAGKSTRAGELPVVNVKCK